MKNILIAFFSVMLGIFMYTMIADSNNPDSMYNKQYNVIEEVSIYQNDAP